MATATRNGRARKNVDPKDLKDVLAEASAEEQEQAPEAPAPAPEPEPEAPAPEQPSEPTGEPTAAERRRARAQASMIAHEAKPVVDSRSRYTLAEGEQWHELPTGGFVGITVADSGIESVVEVSSQNRVKRGVSVGALTVLMDAERI